MILFDEVIDKFGVEKTRDFLIELNYQYEVGFDDKLFVDDKYILEIIYNKMKYLLSENTIETEFNNYF